MRVIVLSNPNPMRSLPLPRDSQAYSTYVCTEAIGNFRAIPRTRVWSKVVSIAEGLYARFSAAAVFLGPYKAGYFFFVDTCNKNLDTFGDNHYYAQKVDTMHSSIKVHGDCC
ncbi:hypothetical protein HID58_079299 [Brassica napus]|uniref:Uncharacterized protein n=1 Tax=Brassica napus TaxID=3708 RepID=A0ABQ7Y1L3_BRANA|nr:hypothetical protein HID58_092440 [Brassica napus]KAH0862088.1 hypothetical protein HID58_079299 [Brassica napus]